MPTVRATPTKGEGIDATGGPVTDPTVNVIALNEAANRRQDDLRAKDKEISDLQHTHQTTITDLRATHEATVGRLRERYQEKIQRAEAGRLDSIRQVDREEVAKTAVAANTAIQTLAKQTTELQQTLAKQVTDTAAAAETRSSAQYNDTNKRLSAVELALSEGKGKQTVADPEMERLTAEVRRLAASRDEGSGKSAGLSQGWAILLGAAGFMLTLLTIGSIIFALLKPAMLK